MLWRRFGFGFGGGAAVFAFSIARILASNAAGSSSHSAVRAAEINASRCESVDANCGFFPAMLTTSQQRFPIVEVYIDESSQTKARFLVLGAVTIQASAIRAFDAALSAARLPELPFSELKWGKVSRGKLAAYRRYVDVFFNESADYRPCFHAVVVDTAKQQHAHFNKGDRETGFNKEIYQLAMKCGRLNRGCIFHVYPDRRSTPHPLAELRTILNHGMHKRFGNLVDWPVRRLQFRHSHEVAALQLVDLFIGAIAYRINGHAAVAAWDSPRLHLGKYILQRASVSDPARDTAPAGKFTIWHRRLRNVPAP